MKRKYGLMVMGRRPVYYDTKHDRDITIKQIKGMVVYSTFSKKIENKRKKVK